MSRYIDADAFYVKLTEWGRIYGAISKDAMQLIIETAPHIDIVRCKECKWATETRLKSIEGDVIYLKTCPSRKEVIDDNDFCSYGEREGE